jgi:hypothetical protein
MENKVSCVCQYIHENGGHLKRCFQDLHLIKYSPEAAISYSCVSQIRPSGLFHIRINF